MIKRGPKSGSKLTTSLRKELRREMTPTEKLFWQKISNRQFLNLKFRRQHGIGQYIVDFYCPERKLIIEIDGDSHAETEGYDKKREQYFYSLGYRTVRYTNRDIFNNIEGVFEDLITKINPL